MHVLHTKCQLKYVHFSVNGVGHTDFAIHLNVWHSHNAQLFLEHSPADGGNCPPLSFRVRRRCVCISKEFAKLRRRAAINEKCQKKFVSVVRVFLYMQFKNIHTLTLGQKWCRPAKMIRRVAVKLCACPKKHK